MQAHSVNLYTVLKAANIDSIPTLTEPQLDLGKTTWET